MRKEMEKYTPSAQKIQENINRMNKEAEGWEKKSQEFQENLPNPEEIQNQSPSENNPNVQ